MTPALVRCLSPVLFPSRLERITPLWACCARTPPADVSSLFVKSLLPMIAFASDGPVPRHDFFIASAYPFMPFSIFYPKSGLPFRLASAPLFMCLKGEAHALFLEIRQMNRPAPRTPATSHPRLAAAVVSFLDCSFQLDRAPAAL